MTKKTQDTQEKIYQDIKNIIEEFKGYEKSEFAKKGDLQHELIVAIIEACLVNKYFEVRYY